jgi:hypothetical protein
LELALRWLGGTHGHAPNIGARRAGLESV